jgi:dihydroxyacetone kinase-like protein
VITDDDVAVEKSTWSTGRRGVAGTLVVERIVGAAAEQGRDLEACRALGDRVNEATRSIGVALTSCTVPAAGRPTFELGASEMEFGVGIHGEPGRRRLPLAPARTIAEQMAAAIGSDFGTRRGTCLLLVNGFGGTPAIELYLMYDNLRTAFEKQGFSIARSLVGSYVTSLEMAGCSATVTLLDDELTGLWDAPVHTAALRWRM